MKHLINKASSHPLISGSIIIFFGSILSSFLNFLFNLFMTRNLSVADYGVLASLLSTTTLFGLIASAFAPIIVKFASPSFVKKDYGTIKGIYIKMFTFVFLLGLAVFLFTTFLSKQIANFFHIEQYFLLPIVGLMSFFSYLTLVNTSFIQAKLAFTFLSLLNLFTGLVRLIGGVTFVLLNYALVGALWAHLISTIIPYIVSFIPLSFIFKSYKTKKSIYTKSIISYGAPATISMLGLTSFVTTDIILVKHFFDPHSAGLYSGISLVGRVIFFFTAPIGTVMFPLVIQKKTQEEKYHTIFELALFLVFIASLCITLFYYTFPVFTIEFFIKNKQYLQVSHLLGLFGLFITIYSMLSIVVNYFLSVGKTKIYIPVTFFAFFQVGLIVLFHTSFQEVILSSTAASGLLLILLLLYYLKTRPYEK